MLVGAERLACRLVERLCLQARQGPNDRVGPEHFDGGTAHVVERVEQVTEKERKRIAADLHDDLGAKLLTIVHTSDSERISTLAREALEEGKGKGCISLRRHQWRMAESNATMPIWLGKNHLGQTDKQEHQHTGANGGPIQTVDLSKVSDDDLKRLEHVLGALAHPGAGGSLEGTDQDGTGETEG